MKKLICCATYFLVFLVPLCIPITAGQHQLPPQKLPQPFSNQMRIGFGFAGEYLNAEAKFTLQPSSGLREIGTQQSQTRKQVQIAPCIEFGNTFGNNYYLGLLVSWRYSGLKSNARSTIEGVQYFQHEFTLKHYTDVFVKAGYKFTPQTMIYGLIGPSLTRWTHTSTQFKNNQAATNKFSTNRIAFGVGFGIGIEHFVHKDYALSLDYTHHSHWPVSKNQSMFYNVQDLPPPAPIDALSGTINRKINLSYATIAVRFTTFFQL